MFERRQGDEFPARQIPYNEINQTSYNYAIPAMVGARGPSNRKYTKNITSTFNFSKWKRNQLLLEHRKIAGRSSQLTAVGEWKLKLRPLFPNNRCVESKTRGLYAQSTNTVRVIANAFFLILKYSIVN